MEESSPNVRWLVSFAIALLLHLLGVLFIVEPLIPEPNPLPPLPPRERTTEVVVRTDAPQEQSGRQIVSVDRPPTAEAPEEARFEDRYQRSVDEEMVNRERGSSRAVVAVQQTEPEVERVEEHRERRRARRERARPQEESPPEEREGDVAMVTDTERPLDQPDLPETTEETGELLPDEGFPLALFNPTYQSASDLIAVPGESSLDHLDLPQGDRTQINSIENLYWSYWDRLKEQVAANWHPTRLYRQRDPTGRIFGVEDRLTVVRVTLNGDGSRRHLFLERSCDLDFLDREAMRAIRAAQPFSNVPEGLKDERGLLSFRFGFFFEISTSSFRIRREDW